jgi:hypothetical protein
MSLGATTRFWEVRLSQLPLRKAFCTFCAIGLLIVFARSASKAQDPVPQDIQAALEHTTELMRAPLHVDARFDYTMTARVRLLLFWVGKDDVGGGYIRRGTLPVDPASDVIELLIGSDPAKAPRAINRWGAASEIVRRPVGSSRGAESSTFFGFMKVSNGASAAEMERELAREKRGGSFLFSAIVNQGEQNFDFAKVVPFSSDTDFTMHEFDQAKSMVFDRLLGSEGRLKEIAASQVQACGRREGFLESVAELVDMAIEAREPYPSECYFYNGVQHQLTLAQVTRVPRRAGADPTSAQLVVSGGFESHDPGFTRRGSQSVAWPPLKLGLAPGRIVGLDRLLGDGLLETGEQPMSWQFGNRRDTTHARVWA